MKPITAVLSPGMTTTERNAALGAISMEAREDRRRRKKMAPDRDEGTGMRQRARADGRCVKTMVLMRPIRRESETATRDDTEERMPATKKRVPKSPSCSLNLRLKKYVTNELDDSQYTGFGRPNKLGRLTQAQGQMLENPGKIASKA
jgi:hypothetical protein